ncbi:MAG: biotin/lipoyl-binding protein [Chloroflexia bacterium]|nr:biotin/lipoyl-binding protein [Chloroflexia bacterium]
MQQPVLAIANRGEIAIRIARTAHRLGWRPVALLGEPDLGSLAAQVVGNVEPVSSELDPEAVVTAAKRAHATALHPGYGFLSERPELSAACERSGILFIGPSPETLEVCGDKLATRAAAERANVPLLPASSPLTLDDEKTWAEHAGQVGYPLMVKVSSAGGGRGLRVARTAGELERSVRSAASEAGGDPTFYLERYLDGARHIEVQVAGDGRRAVALGDRDCSLQRRHQKVIEEAPAPGLSNELRELAHASAVAIANEVRLKGVATVEYLLGNDGTLAFIEVNPRLQVEHTVTEEVTGLDLVEVQLRIATDGVLPKPVAPNGHAIQARLYAEDPAREFLPSPGLIQELDWPDMPRLRVDSGFAAGDEVTGNYDPMLAKFITNGRYRRRAIDTLTDALTQLRVGGIATNRPWLLKLLADERFTSNTHNLSTAGEVVVEHASPAKNDLSSVAAQFIAPLPPPTQFGIMTGRNELRPYDGGSAWQSVGPFRVVGTAAVVFHSIDDGWQETVLLEGCWAAIEGIVVLPTKNGFELSTPRGRWMVAPGPLPKERTAGVSTDGAVRSPMPGTIVTVNVTEGQEVAEGDVLAVMNAMKIEISLAAPFAGRVAAVLAADGELVGSQQVIVRVEPEETADE